MAKTFGRGPDLWTRTFTPVRRRKLLRRQPGTRRIESWSSHDFLLYDRNKYGLSVRSSALKRTEAVAEMKDCRQSCKFRQIFLDVNLVEKMKAAN